MELLERPLLRLSMSTFRNDESYESRCSLPGPLRRCVWSLVPILEREIVGRRENYHWNRWIVSNPLLVSDYLTVAWLCSVLDLDTNYLR